MGRRQAAAHRTLSSASTVAPSRASAVTTRAWLLYAAKWRAVCWFCARYRTVMVTGTVRTHTGVLHLLLTLSAASSDAPTRIRASTVFANPLNAATCSAVLLPCTTRREAGRPQRQQHVGAQMDSDSRNSWHRCLLRGLQAPAPLCLALSSPPCEWACTASAPHHSRAP